MEKCLIFEEMEITYQISKAAFNNKDKGSGKLSKNKHRQVAAKIG